MPGMAAIRQARRAIDDLGKRGEITLIYAGGIRNGGDIALAIRRAINTTGLAVTFTATTLVGGILFWGFSSLRFQAEMAQLLIVLMAINMLGAVTVVPAFYAILKPGGIGKRN